MRRLSALLLGLVATVLAACSAPSGDATDGAGTLGFQGGDGSVVIIPAENRKPAPTLEGTTLDGASFSLADHAGKVMVLNVWGSWCAPCRAEAPALVAAAKAMPEVFFLGINSRDEDPAQAKAFVRAFDIGYPNLYDPAGSLLLGWPVPPKAIPSTLVIDADGKVAARILGETTETTLKGVVEEVVGRQ